MKTYRLFIFIALFLVGGTSLAQEIIHLGRSPYALLRGDAFTATADDAYTLFYNPAGLARNGMGVQASLLNPGVGVTNALKEIDRFEDFPDSDPVLITERLLGFPVYIQAGIFPALKMGPFGFSLYQSTKTSMVIRNAINPVMDIDYRSDKGFVFGFGHSFSFSGKRDKVGQGLSLGASIKLIKREGIKGKFDLFGTKLLSIINAGVEDISSLRDGLGFSEGKGWGVDLGAQYIIRSKFSELSFGFSVLDVGGTDFKRTAGTGEVQEQEMYINSGIAWKQDFGHVDYTLAVDLHPLNIDMDFGRKFHLGLELGMPFVKLITGWSEGYISYGAEVDLQLVKITLGFYGVELGAKFKQEQGKRAVLFLSLFDFSFDG
jgi:hypothetical protein